MGLGKMILFGCTAVGAAVHGHGLLACELTQAPKAVAAVMAVQKPPKLVTLGPRVPIERRDPSYTALPSRRIILQ